MKTEEIDELLNMQRKFFRSGATLPVAFRIEMLKKLRDTVNSHEKEIAAAALVAEIRREIRSQYGETPLDNPDYGKIVNQKHFERLCGLIDPEKVVTGGERRNDTLQIAPTVMKDVTWNDPVMQEEIFGPVLPVLTYRSFEEVYDCLAVWGKAEWAAITANAALTPSAIRKASWTRKPGWIYPCGISPIKAACMKNCCTSS